MALPHSPGRVSDLSAMADPDRSSQASGSSHKSGSSLLSKLVAGKNPFSKSARKLLDHPAGTPPRTTSIPAGTSETTPGTESFAREEPHSALDRGNPASNVETYPSTSTSSSIPNVEQAHPAPEAMTSSPVHQPSPVPQTASGPTALEQQRQELVDRVVDEARKNKLAPLDENGRRVFEQAGFGHLIDKKGDVEVETHWLKPVVQETIIRREHTEITTVITRDIHIHHVYPRIQPIHDPDPIMLQPRHRMFSPRTGHWHEVIGDAEAISLLGEDAFLNGPKQYREIRRAALPGLDSSYEDQPDEIKHTRKARIIERESVEGGSTGHWHLLKRDSSSKDELEDDVHLVDGTEGLGEGIRTMHVSI